MASDNQLTDQDLHAFIDGELDGRGYRAVVGRIAADPELAERANAFMRQRAELAQLRSFFDPDDTPEVANAATQALVQQLAARIRHRRRVRLSLAGSSIAAAALIGLMTAVGPTPRDVAGRLSWRTAIEAGPQVLFGRDPFATT
jgi:anti-sigma factor RsiW